MAAIVYDLLLLLGVFFVATALVLPLNGGRAFNSHQWFFFIYLVSVSFAFYGWFWTHGGQTLGMRAWKLRVLTLEMRPISWMQALVRFGVAFISIAFLGLGFFWAFFDKEKRCWHDIVSKTAIYHEEARV
jgi:uncharacterized RDD family membrane protein YckC